MDIPHSPHPTFPDHEKRLEEIRSEILVAILFYNFIPIYGLFQNIFKGYMGEHYVIESMAIFVDHMRLLPNLRPNDSHS